MLGVGLEIDECEARDRGPETEIPFVASGLLDLPEISGEPFSQYLPPRPRT